MIKTMKPCAACGNTYYDVCTVNREAHCTNCNQRVAYSTRKAKGVYITTSSSEWGDTYFLTKAGWVNRDNMDTKKTPITYIRMTAKVKEYLSCAPYGAESIETVFYPAE